MHHEVCKISSVILTIMISQEIKVGVTSKHFATQYFYKIYILIVLSIIYSKSVSTIMMLV